MDLGTAQQVLVVILSIVLAVSLTLSIVIGILIIRLITSVRHIIDKAEKAVDTAEAVGEAIKRAAGPVGMMRAARTIFNIVSKHNK